MQQWSPVRCCFRDGRAGKFCVLEHLERIGDCVCLVPEPDDDRWLRCVGCDADGIFGTFPRLSPTLSPRPR